MPQHRLLKCPTFSTVTAGGTAVCKLPLGNKRYRAFILKFKNDGDLATETEFRSLITDISFKINGTSVYNISAGDLIDTQMKFKERAFIAGSLIITFADDYARTAVLEDALSLDTYGLQTVDVEVKIASSAVTPWLEMTAFEDMPENAQTLYNNRAIREVRTFDYQVSGKTDFEISDLPKGVGNIVAIHVKPSVADSVDGIEIKADNVMLYNADLDVNKQILSEIGSRTPQSGWIHYDAVVLDRLTDAFPINKVSDYRFKIKTNKATNLRIIFETLRAIQA